MLAAVFLKREGEARLADEAAARLAQHDYPGNISELYSVLRRASALAKANVIQANDLSFLGDDDAPRDKSDRNAVVRELAETRAELEGIRRMSITAVPIWEGRHSKTEADYCFVHMLFADVKDVQHVYWPRPAGHRATPQSQV